MAILMSLLSQKVEHKHVKKAFLLKFGNLYVTPKDIKVAREERIPSFLEEKLKELFNDSPLVKKLKTITVTSKPMSFTRIENSSVELMHPIMLRISLPIKNQMSSSIDLSIFGKDADLTSEFGVVYNGIIYVIFREVDVSKFLFAGGVPDVREVLFDIVSKEESFETKRFPPNPLREYIYLVYLEDKPNVKEFFGKIYREKSAIYLYLSEKQLRNFENTFATFLVGTSTSLDDYYRTISQFKELEKITMDMGKIHKSIQSTIEKFLKISFWNIRQHYTYSKNLEKLLSQHYSALLDYSSNLAIFEKNVGNVEKKLIDDFFLKYFKNELLESVKFDKVDVDTLTKCASFAKELVQRSYTTKATLLGALIGVIGTVIGTVFLHLLGF